MNCKSLFNRLANLDEDFCTTLWDEEDNSIYWEIENLTVFEENTDTVTGAVEFLIKKRIRQRKWNYNIQYEANTPFLEHYVVTVEIPLEHNNKVKIIRGFGESELEALLDAYVGSIDNE